MQTKMLLKKPDQSLHRNPLNSSKKNNMPAANKKNVRTTDYKKLVQIMVSNPNAISREEFIFIQSIIGYRQAIAMREEAILRKKQGKLDGSSINSKVVKNSNNKNQASSNTGMPNNLRTGLEKLSGVDLSDLKVHKNSDKPQQIGALAYTQGSDIHIAPGQEKHLPHEGWHAVQQMQGKVRPTIQMKTDLLVSHDNELEKEADIMGSKAKKEGSKSNTFQYPKSPKPQSGHNARVIQGFGFNPGKLAGNIVKKVAKAGSSGIKTVGNAVKHAAKAGSNGIKAVGNIVQHAAKAGANGIKAVGNIVKHAAKTGANGIKAVGNIVKHAAKTGANGIKAVGNIVKHAAKTGANGIKAVGNIVKHAAKTGANGIKAVGNLVKHTAKAGASGIKTLGKIVKHGVKQGIKGLKSVGSLVKKGAKLGAKGLKTALNVVKQGVKLGAKAGTKVIKKAKSVAKQATGAFSNLKKRFGKLVDFAKKEVYQTVKKNPLAFVKGVLETGKSGIQFGRSLYENFTKNDNMKWNDKIMDAAKDTSLYKSFVKKTQSGAWQELFDVGGFDRDKNGVYHAQQDALQQYGGYNDLYDIVFDFATSMRREKYDYKVGEKEYIVWLWKGDYLNLGAGAEIGIYTGGEPHWFSDVDNAMPMTLSLRDKEGNNIFEWDPKKKNWWCTGFNPNYPDKKAEDLISVGTIDFSGHLDMWEAFYKKYDGFYPWKFYPDKHIAEFEWKN
ncbi:DUF4474 domain-containing protein [Clostridium sp. BNL1100]|uniref:DUF4474 domain-containing protein n=1 Tax=Clostridium sp. BNL1100 TaxID=755731 RepID=UPI00024A75B6|nr:DUF4474 domain-containing protein [Clostridium sp. BNL1100]AEY65566.1 hypothetical protein Clo1100_1324 [Clostridium sp. BNL1100]